MTDRVHPTDSSSDPEDPMLVQQKPASPPVGTYIVQIPKDQIYRVPPPENAHRYEKYARRKSRRNPCCCCLCWIIGIIVLLILLTAVAVGVFYLVVRPKEPNYSVENVSIKGFNLKSDLTLSPEFDVTVRAENPNKKIGIYYEKGSSVVVSYSDINLCTGKVPTFYQPGNNVTIFPTKLKGSGLKLTSKIRGELQEQQNKGKIPLGIDLKVPIKIKVGSVKTWTITVKVHCDITVNKLATDSKIVSKDCKVKVNPWFN